MQVLAGLSAYGHFPGQSKTIVSNLKLPGCMGPRHTAQMSEIGLASVVWPLLMALQNKGFPGPVRSGQSFIFFHPGAAMP